jgi:hypothetical protein
VASHRSNYHIDATGTSDRHLVRPIGREVAQRSTAELLHTSCTSVASHRSNNHIDAASTNDRHFNRINSTESRQCQASTRRHIRGV